MSFSKVPSLGLRARFIEDISVKHPCNSTMVDSANLGIDALEKSLQGVNKMIRAIFEGNLVKEQALESSMIKARLEKEEPDPDTMEKDMQVAA